MPEPMTIVLAVALVFAALALVMTIINLPIYRGEPANASATPAMPPRPVFVCIPARNEEANIERCVSAVLASTYPDLRVLVYDDQSTDETPRILARLAERDRRVSTVPPMPLPEGWVGKMHACHQLGTAAVSFASSYASAPGERPIDDDAGNAPSAGEALILFIDADVELEPGAISTAVDTLRRRGLDLLSTFPRQILGTVSEALVVPMIHFILFSYLPMKLMRSRGDASCCAGCGQFLLIRAATYARIGGHESFHNSMHDGIKMPRTVRAAGGKTDLYHAADSVRCRMYDSFSSTWRGFTKNAYEGIGSPALLAFFTIVHFGAHVLPWAYLIVAWPLGLLSTTPAALAGACIGLNLTQRLTLARAFRHPAWIAFVHPIAITLMTAIQWASFINHLTGRRAWRGRTLQTQVSTPT